MPERMGVLSTQTSHTVMNTYNAVRCTRTHLSEQYSNKSASIYHNTEPKVHPQTQTHTHTQTEQQAEPLCQVAGGGSRLRTSREEERLLAGLERERHKRQQRCPGLDAARGALEEFPGQASRKERRVTGMVFGLLFGCGQPPL